MPSGAVLRRLDHLFEHGNVAGLGEGQLLERYLARRDEAAFEALVARHGPMVLGVCRRVLRDPDAVDDAFQAVFLVLVRKAAAIRDRDLLGPWLHAVATRTAHRARAVASRRRAVEGGSPDTAFEPPDPRANPAARHDEAELRALLDEEVARLPAKYREPVVLCYFQNHTHDEAAARLGWPVGTVRGRLARARDRLRDRLVRRGLAPASAVSSAVLARQAAGSTVPPALAVATARAAATVGTGAALTSVSVSAIVLSREIARSLLMSKLKLAAAVALTATGLVTAGAAVHAFQEPRAAEPGPAVGPAIAEAAPAPVAVVDAGVPKAAEPDLPPSAEPAAPPFGPAVAEEAAALPAIAELPPQPPASDPFAAAEPAMPSSPAPDGPSGLPPAPAGYHYVKGLVEQAGGATRSIYVLIPDDQPEPAIAEAPLRPSDNPNAPTSLPLPPSPRPQPEATASIPPPSPNPEPIPIAAQPPQNVPPTVPGVQDVQGYLESTREQVESKIQSLSGERDSIQTRLQQIESDLASLRALQNALSASGPNAELPPGMPGLPGADPGDEIGRTAFVPSEAEPPMDDLPDMPSEASDAPPSDPPVELPAEAGPDPEARLRDLEDKLDRLIGAIEGLKGEVESIKHRDEDEGELPPATDEEPVNLQPLDEDLSGRRAS